MPSLRTILLALILALLTFTLATAIRTIIWTGPRTLIIFGPGGLKIDHQTTRYATDGTTAKDVASDGWQIPQDTGYTFAYFLRPAWNRTSTDLRIVLPYWPILIALAVPWLVLHRSARRRQKRRVAGACLHCGYDLRRTQTHRCPECGQAPEPA